jgi:heat shock protein HtpX
MLVNGLKTLGVLTLRLTYRAALGYVLGGKIGVATAMLVTLATNLFAYWFSDRIPIGMAYAKLVTPAEFPTLYQTVVRLSEKFDLPKVPRVYIIDASAPNAFASGRDPEHAAVAVTRGALSTLTPDELEAVLAHELFHIIQRDTLVAAVVTSIVGATIGLLDWFRVKFVRISGVGLFRTDEYQWADPINRVLTVVGAALAAVLLPFGVSREREFEADAASARVTGRPLALASALEKLGVIARQVEPFSANPALASLFIVNPITSKGIVDFYSTHPPVEERVHRLEAMIAACGCNHTEPVLVDNELFEFPTLFEGGVQRTTA